MQFIKRLWQDEEAISAVEYGLAAGLIAVALIVVLRAFGVSVQGLFTRQTTQINGVP